MKKKKIVFGALVLLFAVSSVLYAQSNATLRSGVYKYSGYSGAGMVVIQISTNAHTVTIRGNDGEVVARGRLRITGTRVSVDLGNDGFEIWTIVDNETFTDAAGITLHWVRMYNRNEL